MSEPESPSRHDEPKVGIPTAAKPVTIEKRPSVCIVVCLALISASEMSSALNMVYQGGANVTGDVSLTYDEMISRSN